jgi:hypothetical protein
LESKLAKLRATNRPKCQVFYIAINVNVGGYIDLNISQPGDNKYKFSNVILVKQKYICFKKYKNKGEVHNIVFKVINLNKGQIKSPTFIIFTNCPPHTLGNLNGFFMIH